MIRTLFIDVQRDGILIYRGRDGFLIYIGGLCVQDDVGLRQKIIVEAHHLCYSIHLGLMKMY